MKSFPYRKLPLQGVPVGRYFVRIPGRTGRIGPLQFVDGVSHQPAAPRLCRSIQAAFGSRVTFSPGDDRAIAACVRKGLIDPEAPEAVDEEVKASEPPPPPAAPETPLPPPPPPPAPEAGPDLEELDKAALVALAEARGVELDGRWGEARIREALRATSGDG